MTSNISQYYRKCDTYWLSSVPRDKKPRFLNHLLISSMPWEHVSMNYCSLSKDKNGYDSVLVIVDRLSKQEISIPCIKTSALKQLTSLYIYHIYRYFGPNTTILSDHDPLFISRFWSDLNKILGTKIKLSFVDHPQPDRKTEIYNLYL